ncbi:MAG TPA: hypothetical protein VLK33_22995 [Terriglobales bacterium]|nr:hypothetical protein [Terriglobales bacterium]
MKRALLTLLALFTVAGGLYAADCGNGLPCGKLGWTLPAFPVLNSPTPMPTIQITAVQTATAAPTGAPSATPAPTGTLVADFSNVADQLATLAAVVNATQVPVLNASGTPISGDEQYTQLTTDAGTFFGYMRGVQEANLGGFTPWIALLVTTLVIAIATKGAGFLLPVVAVVFRLILRIVEVIKKLIGL